MSRDLCRCHRAPAFHPSVFDIREEATEMTNMEQERWSRVKGRLKAEVGDDIFSSWFARMDLEGVEKDTARLSVPTRFLKSWIQSHYSDRLLRCWQAEEHCVQRIELTV